MYTSNFKLNVYQFTESECVKIDECDCDQRSESEMK